MKHFKKISSILFSFLLVLAGCSEGIVEVDSTPPSPPTNIRTVTGDNRIDLFWDASPQNDVAGYNVYVSSSYQGEYVLIGSTPETYFIDFDAQNGNKYYYAVTAYDFNGNESELSYDMVYDTPRPEGFNQAIFDYRNFPSRSGYSFSEYSVVPFDDDYCDFFFENDSGYFYLNVWEDTDIQDMGATADIYDVTQAPLSGWVKLLQGNNVKFTEAVVGHTYVIWTWDNHFAKIRISSITEQRVVFDWAYQTAEGNPELKIKRGGVRSKHNAVIKK